MNDAESEKVGFIRQRRAGMAAIAAAMPVALLLGWRLLISRRL